MKKKRALALALLISCFASGIILHTGHEPDPMDDSWRPNDNVFGRFLSGGGSLIANFSVIAPNWIASSRHQGSEPSTVVIDSNTYNCEYRPEWKGGSSGNADLQLVRLTKLDGSPAMLTDFTPIYEDTNELGQQAVVGGYGFGRGADVERTFPPFFVYGYEWDGVPNAALRRCTNNIELELFNDSFLSFTSDALVAYFDDIGTTIYEGTGADKDSGGGWFLNASGKWYLAAVTSYVTAYSGSSTIEAWFRNPNDPQGGPLPDPHRIVGVRISSYSTWINNIIHTEGDVTGDDFVDMYDYAKVSKYIGQVCNAGNNFCDGTDIAEPFGKITLADLAVVTGNWLTGIQ